MYGQELIALIYLNLPHPFLIISLFLLITFSPLWLSYSDRSFYNIYTEYYTINSDTRVMRQHCNVLVTSRPTSGRLLVVRWWWFDPPLYQTKHQLTGPVLRYLGPPSTCWPDYQPGIPACAVTMWVSYTSHTYWHLSVAGGGTSDKWNADVRLTVHARGSVLDFLKSELKSRFCHI